MSKKIKISAADLFCGVGGLTYGLEQSGVSVRLGIDIDASCRHPIEANTRSRFIRADVAEIAPAVVASAFKTGDVSLLAGCAPCQPFSTYSQSAKRDSGKSSSDARNEDWKLVERFGELIEELEPDLVTMENVPPLARQPVFEKFLRNLKDYFVDYRVVECETAGLPQTRRRLVLMASKLGPISIPEFDLKRKTVRDTIGVLPPLKAGGVDPRDKLHRASKLSAVNYQRIRASKPGGTWRDWPVGLRAACHTRSTGETYPAVYGRMVWDEPAPTITTQCFGYGNGRFGHPEQDRAISLREAAMLQGFPSKYSFIPDHEPVSFAKLGRLIGNAVPVTLGRAIGDILIQHVQLHNA